MNRPHRSCHPALSGLLLGILAIGAGCSRVLGPVAMPVSRVHGVIVEGTRPISGGWIEFMPCGGTVGNLRSARIAVDGTFDADRVAVGENAIRVVNEHVEDTPYLQIIGKTVSPIRRAIGTESPANLTIDLRDEARRFHESRRRMPAPASAAEAGEDQP